jgi:hypothetical protein
VRESLCAKIAEQTNSVPTGDLVALFLAITLAIGFIDRGHNLEALEIAYAKTNMEAEGQNDIMTYISVLASQLRRLKTAGHTVSDTKACRVLLTGLHQDVFESFIAAAERTPYPSYPLLVQALQQAASKPHTIVKLRALLPGTSHSAFTTRTSLGNMSPTDQRLDRLETIMATMASGGNKTSTQLPCFAFKQSGTCTRGDTCPYAHTTDRNPATATGGSRTVKYCAAHQTSTHNTADCSMINANPKLKAFYAADALAQPVTTTMCTMVAGPPGGAPEAATTPCGASEPDNDVDYDPTHEFLI